LPLKLKSPPTDVPDILQELFKLTAEEQEEAFETIVFTAESIMVLFNELI